MLMLLQSTSTFLCGEIGNAEWMDRYPSAANLSTSWRNSPSSDLSYWVRPILVSGSFICGFYCDRSTGGTCLFAVSIFSNSSDVEMVWSANRNNPVNGGAKLQLTQDGNLLLTDKDDNLIWSAATSGESVLGLKLTEEGNLVLFGRNNTVAWQSFDHPTDSLVPGQRLLSGKRLISASASNWSQGLYSFALENHRLVAYMNLDRRLVYYDSEEFEGPYAEYKAGYFGPFRFPLASSAQFIKLGTDGHLRAYEWRKSKWLQVSDLLTEQIDSCGYPLACGNYGICFDGQCTCPKPGYFSQIDNQPDHGCTANAPPISCDFSQFPDYLMFNELVYPAFELGTQINGTDEGNCELACRKNCSCKAAVFRYKNNYSSGICSLQSEVMSFIHRNESLLPNSPLTFDYQFITFIKVQHFLEAQDPVMENAPEKKSEHAHPELALALGSSLGSAFGIFLMITIFLILRNRKNSEESQDEYLDVVSEMPCRFCYEELKAITGDFSNLLGEGGFGSVFEGTLPNGTKVAVKCLNGSGQVKKSFLAEVLTIGSIHHVNLVRLIGFCAQKNHRFLVYEYMCEGSLDKWIFQIKPQVSLGWRTRKKIIHDIAKGLAYLHQECRQKIFHLDVKPQNILLDENFNAKVSDFGLAKLVDKDLSQVVTTMRGTPGYMAPEWLSSVITEKVDVYSFGVVVMEILCGRKNVDRSQPEEKMHLLTLLKKKAEEGELLDLVDKNSQDMQMNGAEVVEMMKVAVWCLQGDYAKRPSMSVVVKALEGSLAVEENLEYVFWVPPEHRALGIQADGEVLGTVIQHSALSGPR